MKHNAYLAALVLAIFIVARVIVQRVLYAYGFEALTADDFGRVVIAALWTRAPHAIWQGPWLPFHTYFVGLALYIWNDLLVVPRSIACAFGAASLCFMYALTHALFADRRIALISVVLLAVNPAHIWLSSVPLTEIIQTTCILGFLWANVAFIRRKQLVYFYLSVAMLSIDNTVRFEGWIFSVFFTIQLLFYAINTSGRKSIHVRNVAIAGLIVWSFPIAWVIGNYLETGDPLFFMTVNQAFDAKLYGNRISYVNYVRTFLALDPYTTALAIPTLLLCLAYFKQNRAVYWTIVQVTLPLIAFAILQRGQIQPYSNYIRYLAVFLFISYPFSAWLIDMLAGKLLASRTAQLAAITLVLALLGSWQLRTTFRFVNAPAAEGLRVGQQIRALRLANPALAARPMLIELDYWQYLAIHVGANDLSSLVYDRALDLSTFNTSSSLIEASPSLLPACIRLYHFSYIVVRSAALRQIVQSYLNISPTAEYDGYAIYPVADSAGGEQADRNQTCPLQVGSGY